MRGKYNNHKYRVDKNRLNHLMYRLDKKNTK